MCVHICVSLLCCVSVILSQINESHVTMLSDLADVATVDLYSQLKLALTRLIARAIVSRSFSLADFVA